MIRRRLIHRRTMGPRSVGPSRPVVALDEAGGTVSLPQAALLGIRREGQRVNPFAFGSAVFGRSARGRTRW